MFPVQTPHPAPPPPSSWRSYLVGGDCTRLNLLVLLFHPRPPCPCTVHLSRPWALMHHLCQAVVDLRTERGRTGKQELWERAHSCRLQTTLKEKDSTAQDQQCGLGV